MDLDWVHRAQLPTFLLQKVLPHPLSYYFLLYFIKWLRLKNIFFNSQSQSYKVIVSGTIP